MNARIQMSMWISEETKTKLALYMAMNNIDHKKQSQTIENILKEYLGGKV